MAKKWEEFPKTSKRVSGPKTNTVTFYSYKHKSDVPNRGRLAFSSDLVSGKRVSIEHDGGGMLRVRFGDDGHSALNDIQSSARMSAVELRISAVKMFPSRTTRVEFVKKDGIIYIDTNQFADQTDSVADVAIEAAVA